MNNLAGKFLNLFSTKQQREDTLKNALTQAGQIRNSIVSEWPKAIKSAGDFVKQAMPDATNTHSMLGPAAIVAGGSQLIDDIPLKNPLGLITDNPTGTAVGLTLTVNNPQTVEDVRNERWGNIGLRTLRDEAIGISTEIGAEQLGKELARRAPTFASRVLPVGSQLGYGATGLLAGKALFKAGRDDGLATVAANKAAEYQIPYLPSNNPNPETDLGARASRAMQQLGGTIWNSIYAPMGFTR